MIINKVPEFDKIELLIKNFVNDMVMPSTTKVEFKNCDYKIHGDYLTIIEFGSSELEITTTNRIFNLMDVSAFKTFIYK